MASALGPVVGGLLTEKVSWRWCFFINCKLDSRLSILNRLNADFISVPLDGAALLIILLFLDIKTPKTPLLEGLRAIDWLGAITIVGGTVMLLFGLELGGVSKPWKSAAVLCLIIFGGLYKKIDIFSSFIEGAKGGFETTIRVIPYLVGMLVAISVMN